MMKIGLWEFTRAGKRRVVPSTREVMARETTAGGWAEKVAEEKAWTCMKLILLGSVGDMEDATGCGEDGKVGGPFKFAGMATVAWFPSPATSSANSRLVLPGGTFPPASPSIPAASRLTNAATPKATAAKVPAASS